MSYPQYPAQGAYPQMGPPPGYPAAGQQQPGGGTAITAGVLAILGGLWALVGVVTNLAGAAAMAGLDSYRNSYGAPATPNLPELLGGYLIATGIVQVIVALLLIVGAVLLFMKKKVGRWLVVSGCALVVLSAIAGFVVMSAHLTQLESGATLIGGGVALVLLAFPVATLVLAILPSTARWCAFVKPSVPSFGPPGGSYPPSGGFGGPMASH